VTNISVQENSPQTDTNEKKLFLEQLESSKAQRWLRAFEPWGILIAVFGLMFSVWALYIDRTNRYDDIAEAEELRQADLKRSNEDRRQAQIVNSWQLVAIKAYGNSGKVPALQYLHSQNIDLIGIDLSPPAGGAATHLNYLKLPGANLWRANLSNTSLFTANMSGANLSRAKLICGYLVRATLTDARMVEADLTRANLTRAELSGVNLSGANLYEANLSSAKLSEAENLDPEALTGACGDGDTELPAGFKKLPVCGEDRTSC